MSDRALRSPTIAPALGAALAAIVALGGCGSSKTTTAFVGSTTGQPPSSAQPTTKSTRATSTSPTSAPKSGLTGAQAPGTPHRSAPAPAFIPQGGAGEGLSAAIGVLKAHGFNAGDTGTYRPGQTLRVLVGTRTNSSDGYAQQAFFFENGRYLGTDTSQPSAHVEVVSQADTEVTLAYSLYRPHDPLCCPKGGRAMVRFQLDNGHLQALDSIPPLNSTSDPSRQ